MGSANCACRDRNRGRAWRRRWRRRTRRREDRSSRGRGRSLTRSSVTFAAAPPVKRRPTYTCWRSTTCTAPSSRQHNIYGQFAGGAAYLAKVVKDRQAQYGDRAGDGLRGRQHRRSPLQNGLFHEEPIVIASQPDARRLRLCRQPRVRQGQQPSCCGFRTAAAIRRRLHGGAVCTAGRRRPRTSTRARLQVPVRQRDRGRDRPDAVPGVRRSSSSPPTDGKKFKVGFIGEVLESTPTIVTPTGVAGLTFQDEADAANRAVAELGAQGREGAGSRHPRGRFPDRAPPRSTGAPAIWPAARSPTSRAGSIPRSR